MRKQTTYRTAEENRQLVLRAAARLFMQKGYVGTSLREIAKASGVNMGSVTYIYEHKDSILTDMVSRALNTQFAVTAALLKGYTEDKMKLWVAEMVLQLCVAESNEQLRELFLAAYSNPQIAAIVYENSVERRYDYFHQFNPQYEIKDFFEVENAVGGIIRSFMALPCDMYFTLQRKIRRFLEITGLVYRIPEDEIKSVISFILTIDFSEIVQQIIETIVSDLGIEEEMIALRG